MAKKKETTLAQGTQAKETMADAQLSQLVRQENIKKILYWVAAAHIALIVAAAIGLPSMHKEPFDLSQAVAVDLVAPTGEFSAAPNKSKSPKPFTPKAKPVTKKETKPPIAKPDKPPEPVKTEAAPKVETPKPVEEKPPPPKEAVKEPKKEATEKAEKIKDEKPKKPVDKKKPDDGAKTATEQKDFNDVMKNLLGAENAEPEGNPVDAPHDPDTKVEGKAPVTSETLALSEMDALKYQLAQCWNVPVGAMDAENLIVDIRVEVGADRVVKRADIVDQSRYNSDSFFRAAADSARRAMFNPRCSPLNVPADKFDTWNTMLIRFNPKEMFGG